jgi:hypothetical protein
MDFTQIWASISPYVSAGAIGTVVTATIGVVVKVVGAVKSAKTQLSETKQLAVDLFKTALPKDLTISIKKLAQDELKSLTASVTELINKQVIEPVKANTELQQAIAKALISLRSIPETLRTEISALINEPTAVMTTESIKLEMNTELQAEAETLKTVSKKIYLE